MRSWSFAEGSMTEIDDEALEILRRRIAALQNSLDQALAENSMLREALLRIQQQAMEVRHATRPKPGQG